MIPRVYGAGAPIPFQAPGAAFTRPSAEPQLQHDVLSRAPAGLTHAEEVRHTAGTQRAALYVGSPRGRSHRRPPARIFIFPHRSMVPVSHRSHQLGRKLGSCPSWRERFAGDSSATPCASAPKDSPTGSGGGANGVIECDGMASSREGVGGS